MRTPADEASLVAVLGQARPNAALMLGCHR